MGIFKKNVVFSEAEYLIWKIEEEVEDLKIGLKLSKADQAKLSEIHHEIKIKEFLAIRQLLKIYFGENKAIRYTPNGKPFLVDSNIPISFSHCKGFAAILIGKNSKIGIDIETDRENILRIAPKFMNSLENQSLSEDNRMQHLLFYWGAKEVVVKIEDDKTFSFKNSISVSPFSYSNKCHSQAQLISDKKRGEYDLNFENLTELLLTCGIKKG
tara:strand:+ start:56715 stop:57353 length:639 start_codon:yes stop_codon:yes gene_type:complete